MPATSAKASGSSRSGTDCTRAPSARGRSCGSQGEIGLGSSGWRRDLDPADEDLLAAEEPPLLVPREPDEDLPLEPVVARLDPEPRRLVRRGDVRLLDDALRPDDDVGEVELDVGER